MPYSKSLAVLLCFHFACCSDTAQKIALNTTHTCSRTISTPRGQWIGELWNDEERLNVPLSPERIRADLSGKCLLFIGDSLTRRLAATLSSLLTSGDHDIFDLGYRSQLSKGGHAYYHHHADWKSSTGGVRCLSFLWAPSCKSAYDIVVSNTDVNKYDTVILSLGIHDTVHNTISSCTKEFVGTLREIVGESCARRFVFLSQPEPDNVTGYDPAEQYFLRTVYGLRNLKKLWKRTLQINFYNDLALLNGMLKKAFQDVCLEHTCLSRSSLYLDHHAWFRGRTSRHFRGDSIFHLSTEGRLYRLFNLVANLQMIESPNLQDTFSGVHL